MPDATTTTDPKPGYKTSEFWLKLLAFLLSALYASGVIPTTGTVPQVVAIAATILGALGYTVVRGMVKAAASSPPATSSLAIAGQVLETPPPPKA